MLIFKCNYECSQIGGLSCGPTEYECFKCAHYSLEIESNKMYFLIFETNLLIITKKLNKNSIFLK